MQKLYSSAAVMLLAGGTLLASAAPAFAGPHVDLSIGVGVPAMRVAPPVIYSPPPVIYGPPTVVYPPPQPLYAPPPAYVSPITVYRTVPPAYVYGYRENGWHRHEWRERREHAWRERREHEWRERHEGHRHWHD